VTVNVRLFGKFDAAAWGGSQQQPAFLGCDSIRPMIDFPHLLAVNNASIRCPRNIRVSSGERNERLKLL
jgi:hypothetical protein